ncbi:nucleoside-diphosphate sugar epimerase/dehydratase, partial [Kaistella sp.]
MKFRKVINKRIYSGDNLMGLSDIRYLPRWVILIIDICFIALAIYFACYIIEKLSFSSTPVFLDGSLVFLMILAISVVFMFAFRTYAGIIRHSTFIDLFKLFLATFGTTLVVAVISFSYYLTTGKRMIYMSIPFLVIFSTASFMLMFLFRLFVKEFFHFVREIRRSSLRKRILVLGIDEQAVAMARALLDNATLPYHIVGFLTQRNDSKRASLLGKPIYTKEKIENSTKEDLAIDGVLLIKEIMTKEEINSWVTLFLEKDLQVYKAPELQKLKSNDQEGTIKT